jgi:hypothetical protein
MESDNQDAAAAPRRAGWKEENKGYQSNQIHCGGGARSGTRRGCGKIVGLRFLSYVCICAKFFFHTFFLSSALPGICLYVQFYWVLAEWVL